MLATDLHTQPRLACAHVNSFSYFSWYAPRFICCKGQIQNLTSVCTVVKPISTWSNSPGSNLPTPLGIWCNMCQQQESAEDLSCVFSEQCVQITVRLLLSTVTYRKLVHLQWKGTAQAKDVQFLCCNCIRTFYSIFRRIPPQAPLWLVMHSVWIIVLCGMLYKSNISRTCSLY
jgi:hypothetical protein